MDLLGRLLTGSLQATTPGPSDDYWYQPVDGVMTASGLKVGPEGAQKLSAWYRGRDILATVLAMLPLPVYRRLPNDGGSEVAADHPLYDVLHDKPNDFQDSFQWRRQGMFDLIDHGHFYNWIVPGPRGFADQLVPIDPTLVTPKQQTITLANGAVINGRMLYDVRNPKTGGTKTFTQDEVFDLPGADGKGILEYARSSLGTALATESYAAQIFGRGTLNGGVIEVPGPTTPDANTNIARVVSVEGERLARPEDPARRGEVGAEHPHARRRADAPQPEAFGRRHRALARHPAPDAREQRSVVRQRRAVRSELHHLQHGRLAVAVRIRGERDN
jgi:hypothetical protein